MPTRAVHLALAEEMLRRGDLSDDAGCPLIAHRDPFLLGHTAPDVRPVSGQRREDCDFYTVPRRSDQPACQSLVRRMPIASTEIEQVARSPQQIDRGVFRLVPRSALRAFEEAGYDRSVRLIGWYAGGPIRIDRDVPDLAASLPARWFLATEEVHS